MSRPLARTCLPAELVMSLWRFLLSCRVHIRMVCTGCADMYIGFAARLRRTGRHTTPCASSPDGGTSNAASTYSQTIWRYSHESYWVAPRSRRLQSAWHPRSMRWPAPTARAGISAPLTQSRCVARLSGAPRRLPPHGCGWVFNSRGCSPYSVFTIISRWTPLARGSSEHAVEPSATTVEEASAKPAEKP